MAKWTFLNNVIYKRTVKSWLVILFVWPAIPFFVVTLGFVVFSYFPWPLTFDVEAPVVSEQKDELIILIHGKDDSPDTWPTAFAKALETSVLTDKQQVATIDWYDYSTNLFRVANNARRIGHQLGEDLAEYSQLKKVHLIAHSAGAFMAYGYCETLKQLNPDVFVQTTYLDPLGPYSGFQWHYGTQHFGSCADVSDAYIDIHDNVPGSNVPVEHTHTFDVSALRLADKKYQGTAHMWPIHYYRTAVLSGQLPFWEPGEEVLGRYPRRKHTIFEGQ
ncbi:alpha/beta fold hydrolase [uncultured Alteromonas sp.]|jgi:pimeloyl-ACP methyl ester carboxylesterase|uniref:alpha/beta fold hydrolase n=1 Tax=uncultured Alteromonas sp. TaxID=179113 RepID=UPI0025FF7B11|nr:alpha/beta fold hydrolase [uncultured Alteromonas sp.]